MPTFLEALDLEDRAWLAEAACGDAPDPDAFYVQEKARVSTRGNPYPKHRYQSRKVLHLIEDYCAPCPVRRDCLEYGLRDETGIWGGLNPEDRLKVRHLPTELALRHLEARFEPILEERRKHAFKSKRSASRSRS